MRAPTVEVIEQWYDAAPKTATHMIVICDDSTLEHYPMYIEPGHDARELVSEYAVGGHPQQRVMEVYLLGWNKEHQLATWPAAFYEKPLEAYDADVLAVLGDLGLVELELAAKQWPGLWAKLVKAELARRRAHAEWRARAIQNMEQARLQLGRVRHG